MPSLQPTTVSVTKVEAPVDESQFNVTIPEEPQVSVVPELAPAPQLDIKEVVVAPSTIPVEAAPLQVPIAPTAPIPAVPQPAQSDVKVVTISG